MLNKSGFFVKKPYLPSFDFVDSSEDSDDSYVGSDFDGDPFGGKEYKSFIPDHLRYVRASDIFARDAAERKAAVANVPDFSISLRDLLSVKVVIDDVPVIFHSTEKNVDAFVNLASVGITAVEIDVEANAVYVVDNGVAEAPEAVLTMRTDLYESTNKKAIEKAVVKLGLPDVSGALSVADIDECKGVPEEMGATFQITDVEGLMYPHPVVKGNHGYYEQAVPCLRAYCNSPIDILYIRGMVEKKTGQYGSADAAVVVRVPDAADDADLLFRTTVSPLPYNELVAMCVFDRDKELNAVMGQFVDELNEKGVGVTPTGLYYSVLDGRNPSLDEFMEGYGVGRYGEVPVLITAVIMQKAYDMGVIGSFVYVDLPKGIGIYFSPEFMRDRISPRVCVNGRLESVPGYYVMRDDDVEDRPFARKILRDFILSWFVGAVYGPDVQNRLVSAVVRNGPGDYEERRRRIRGLLELQGLYGRVKPNLFRRTMLVPYYTPLEMVSKIKFRIPPFGTYDWGYPPEPGDVQVTFRTDDWSDCSMSDESP